MTVRSAAAITDAESLNRLPDRTLARLEPSITGAPALCVVKVDGEIRALADRCPHGRARLSAGVLDRDAVACRAHGLSFDLWTGQSVEGLCGAATPYVVTVHDDQVVVSRASRGGWFRFWKRHLRRRCSDDARSGTYRDAVMPA